MCIRPETLVDHVSTPRLPIFQAPTCSPAVIKTLVPITDINTHHTARTITRSRITDRDAPGAQLGPSQKRAARRHYPPKRKPLRGPRTLVIDVPRDRPEAGQRRAAVAGAGDDGRLGEKKGAAAAEQGEGFGEDEAGVAEQEDPPTATQEFRRGAQRVGRWHLLLPSQDGRAAQQHRGSHNPRLLIHQLHGLSRNDQRKIAYEQWERK